MPDALVDSLQLVRELKASAHLMTLQPGMFCVYHSEGSPTPDPATGLPGARLTLPPGPGAEHVTITSFRDDGWLGGPDSAALVRVTHAPAQILMTVYMLPDGAGGAPRLQVMRLADPAASPNATPSTVSGSDGGVQEPEMAAHIQLRGDVPARLGEWLGERGSQRWIEGFAVAPHEEVSAEEIEYQAVLGRGWLSPWSEGGQFCGSRGMALPILGLRVRLRGAAQATHGVEVNGCFTDGAMIGPVAAGEPCEAPSLAPLEAFQIILRRLEPAAPARPAKLVAAKKKGPGAGKGLKVVATPKKARAKKG